MKIVKVGQVYKAKENEKHVVIVAMSKDGKYIVNGMEEEFVDPIWETAYLLKNYELDERF